MKKALSLAAVTALSAMLGVVAMPQTQAAPEVDQAALSAKIDARLHTVLTRLARQAEARRQAQQEQQRLAAR